MKTTFKDFPSPDIARSLTGPDILQKHSINSLLLEHNEIISRGLPSPIDDGRSRPESEPSRVAQSRVLRMPAFVSKVDSIRRRMTSTPTYRLTPDDSESERLRANPDDSGRTRTTSDDSERLQIMLG
uniref:Uncharacterized protein n=1 Tax=Anopheles melas TaxID=34690 RepID=A0A182TG86_9DIPT